MVFDKEELVKHRLSRAKESADDAKFALENNRLNNAENRIYYAIFYSVSALAIKNDYSTSKHFQLMGWFNKNFIKTGKIDKEFGRIYKRQFENRLESDYDDFIELSYEQVKEDYENMQSFLEEIEKFI